MTRTDTPQSPGFIYAVWSMMTSATSVIDIARRAREASLALQCLSTERKNDALHAIKQLLSERREAIEEANRKDLEVCGG